MGSMRRMWCAIGGEAKAFEVDVTGCEYVYDLKQAAVDASKIDIPYFRVEIWKVKNQKQWPADQIHTLWNIPYDTRRLRMIADRLYTHETLDVLCDRMESEEHVSIVMQLKNGRKSLHSIAVREHRVWCAFVGQSQIFQVDIAKCKTGDQLIRAIARDANLAVFKINEVWRVKDPHQWTVNDRFRQDQIPKTKEDLAPVADKLEFAKQLKEDMFDEDLRMDNIYLFARLKMIYSLPSIPAIIKPIWCVVAGTKRAFQIDIGRCASMSEVIKMAEDRSGIRAVDDDCPILYKIKNPRMWPLEKLRDSAFPEYDDEFEKNMQALHEDDPVDRLSLEDSILINDYISLVLDVLVDGEDLLEYSEAPSVSDRFIWCAIGKPNFVCRVNIGGCRYAYEVLHAIENQSKFRLLIGAVNIWKMKRPQNWPVGDVVKGLKRIPESGEEVMKKIALLANNFDDAFSGLEEDRCKDNVCVFIQMLCENLSTGSIDAINPFVDRDDIHAALDELGFRSDAIYVALDRRHIGQVYTHDNREYYVKYLRPGRSDEIKILEYLLRFPSPQNHSPDDVISYDLEEGALLLTPDLGIPVKKYEHLSRDLLSIVQQLLEGVGFLHTHGVAHLDLKCSHVIVNESGRLWIVDYDISAMLKDGKTKVRGYRGTEGCTAPEVGSDSYNAYLADVWATGRIVRELCRLCPDHKDFGFLSSMSDQLMATDPVQRSSMSTHIKTISDYIVTTSNIAETSS